MLIFPAILILAYIVLFVTYKRQSTKKENIFNLKKNEKVLFVTAHPDDECMFFSPTLLYLHKRRVKVHLLCLSTGNYYHIGQKRIPELYSSCAKLGILQERVEVLDVFKDDPDILWADKDVSETIKQHMSKLGCHFLFTFDNWGVSGHRNHKSVYYGTQYLLKENMGNGDMQVHYLQSVNYLRKYMQVLDIFESLFYSIFYHNKLITGLTTEYSAGYNAMLCHKSQLVWYRKLFIIFSRYMLMNTWESANNFQYKKN